MERTSIKPRAMVCKYVSRNAILFVFIPITNVCTSMHIGCKEGRDL